MITLRQVSAFSRLAAAATALFVGGQAALAQQPESASVAAATGGSSAHPSAPQVLEGPQVSIGRVSAANVYTSAQFGAAGVALRNRGAGSISLSGVIKPVKAAFLYWAVITSGAPTPAVRNIRLQREFPYPLSATVQVTGSLIGSGQSPCWGGTGIFVYKAAVPTSIVNGNGLYLLRLATGASGRIDGQDPWRVSSPFPLFEGASLVVVGTGNDRVALYDRGLAGRTFINSPSGLSYTLGLPVTASGLSTLFGSIGADGQVGTGLAATAALAGDITAFNSTRIAGPGSLVSDGDWNGGAGGPLPQLWDTTVRNVSRAVRSGATSVSVGTFVTTSGITDCLTPVANIISIR